MRIAIFGLPYSGKTTIFECLTHTPGSAPSSGAAAQKKGKGGAVLGTVKVPDSRVDELTRIYNPKKTTYAEILFEDIPSPADRTSSAVLDTKATAQLRTADVLAMVLRGFPSPLVEAAPDPKRDLATLEDELLLADLGVVEKRVERLVKEKQTGVELQTLKKCQTHLEEGAPLRTLELSHDESESIKGFALLTRKKLLVVVNTSEDAPTEISDALVKEATQRGSSAMPLCGSLEAEIAQLSPEEGQAFLADMGVASSGKERFIQHAFKSLDLISFLTSGEDECRAWPIPRGTPARRAAGTIHSDIERGFIRAEVLSFDDFMAHDGSEKKAKAAGRYRLEGRDYIVQDGDIISFRFNV